MTTITASSRSAAKVWLAVFAAGFAVISALLAWTVVTPIAYGDLSRTGLLSESEFGWTLVQPEVPAGALRDSPLDQADVLVIGDSFSMSRHWQSVLVRDGVRVATASWGQYGSALCRDLDARLAEAGFRGRLVVVQSVERSLKKYAEASVACSVMRRPIVATREAPVHTPVKPAQGFAGNWSAQLMTGWRTWWNTRQARLAAGDTRASADTLVRAVQGGCRQFTHRLCDKALFFGDDLKNGELLEAEAQNLAAITRATKTPLLWMVVPNKTTVYVDTQHSRAFREPFAAQSLGPDLFAFAEAQRFKTPDFYQPNDTHLSLRGELVLGERMLTEVRARLKAAPP